MAAVFAMSLGTPLGTQAVQAAVGVDDTDGNGIEDVLDDWRNGLLTWQDLRQQTRHSRAEPLDPAKQSDADPFLPLLVNGPWTQGQVRILALGVSPGTLAEARQAAASAGQVEIIHDLADFGGVQVLALDGPALQSYLDRSFSGRILLDREGLPALAQSRVQVGAQQLIQGHWQLGSDWSSTLAILDSGCDTAHGDLGDYAQDNHDGPPPEVGDAADWYPASNGWPLFDGFKVVGWHDVSDDFPAAQGPWDYHHHGTALASVVAGAGTVDPQYAGINPGGRLTVVKFYDFDGTWHAWAGDFLAACAWTLEHCQEQRIRAVLTAVNWEADLGISEAMTAFVDAGLVPVAAMGNFGTDPAGPGYPASLPEVLTVGSVDPDNAVSLFSGRGLPGQAKPDLLAPGGHVVTADNEPDDTYSMRQGTSLSAAHVAGALYMLEEALVDNGIHLPADRWSVLTRMALLRGATARVTQAAGPGNSRINLTSHDAPDQTRGWGLLRVDAAARGLLQVIFPGDEQADTLSLDTDRPTTARLLAVNPDIRYLVEAVPQPGLDVALDIIDPRLMDDDPFGAEVVRENSNGPGVSEFAYHHALPNRWAFLVVRRVSGSGIVTLRVQEADDFLQSAIAVQLPGTSTGAPNSGRLAGSPGPTLVVPSRVVVDHVARSVNVLDATGISLPGWPVFVFPQSSAQGGLGQPLVWDLDGINGDEIVLGSEFGSVYFFNRLGAWVREDVGFNLPLTTVVGVEMVDGPRRVVSIAENGLMYAWTWGPVLETVRDLGQPLPLDPAVGQLLAGPDEEMVVAFASGTVLAMDALGNDLPGWPVELQTDLETAPVLCDLDQDGLHEIVLVDLDEVAGNIRFHVLRGNGQPGPGDGVVLSAPTGGDWLGISPPVVAGRYGTGDLRVSVSGLMDNGLAGTEASWQLGLASLLATGQAASEMFPGFQVKGTTSQGVLTLQGMLMPTPIAYDYLGGTGADESVIFSLQWTELLYGLTAIDGAASGLFQLSSGQRPLEGRQSLRLGGAQGTSLGAAGMGLIGPEGGLYQQVRAIEDQLFLSPTRVGHGLDSPWKSARADQRNSGAYPLASQLTPALTPPAPLRGLAVYPNPGSARFHFRLDSGAAAAATELRVYDLRGRHIRSLRAGPGKSLPVWDGLDQKGRQVAAGTYLAVARQGTRQTSARFVVTR